MPRKQILNEAFKRFQRLPDWPISATDGIRATCRIEQANGKTQQEAPLPTANGRARFTNVLTG